MKYAISIFIVILVLIAIIYLGGLKSCEGFSMRNQSPIKGCVEPMSHSGNCGDPGKSGDIYMTKSINEAKEEIWTVCPYECSKEGVSDDVSICKNDKECISVDAKTGKYNHACIIKLNIPPDKVHRDQVKRFSSRREMEKALGYKICSRKDHQAKKNYQRHSKPGGHDMNDMIINPDTEGEHQTPVQPGGGAGPHGSQLPNPSHPGPGMPDAHGGNPDLSCYPPPPKHYKGHHPSMNTVSNAPGQRTLPHSPHAPFSSHGSFVAPHMHNEKPPPSSHHSKSQPYQCECS